MLKKPGGHRRLNRINKLQNVKNFSTLMKGSLLPGSVLRAGTMTTTEAVLPDGPSKTPNKQMLSLLEELVPRDDYEI